MELGAGAASAGDGEILDEVITRSRGEFRHSFSPKITSSTSTPASELKPFQSSPGSALYSPRVRELRRGRSSGGGNPQSPNNDESKPSSLGKSPLNSALN